MSFYSDASLVLIPSGYKDQKVYSAVPTDGSGDLVFSRASSATRVASDGLIEKVRTNLALYSEQLDNAYWIKAGSPTITVTANAGTAPDGTTTADRCSATSVATSSRVYTTTTWGGGEYTLSLYVKNNGGTNTNFRFSYYDSVSQYFSPTITLTNEWQRVTYTFTPAAGAGGFWLVNTPSESGNLDLLAWGAQLETGVATDYIATTSAAVSVGPVSGLPRLDYLNSTCPRLLLEPQRTNLLLNNLSIIGNTDSGQATPIVSPDGYENGRLPIPSSTSSRFEFIFAGGVFASGTVLTYSWFVKTVSTPASPSPTTGQLSQFSVSVNATAGTPTKLADYGNGWERWSITYTIVDGSLQSRLRAYYGGIIGVGNSAIAYYGHQIEQGTYATSLIPTLGTSVTRVADAAEKTGISSLIGQTEGTLFLDFVFSRATESFAYFAIQNASATSRVRITYTASSNTMQLDLVISGSASVLNTFNPVDGTRYKMAIGYKSGDSVAYRNGVQVGTQAATFTFTDLSILTYDNPAAAGTQVISGRHNQTLLFPTRLSNSDLAALTA
jgi:hypothetical protein